MTQPSNRNKNRVFRKNAVYHPVMPREKYYVAVNYLASGQYVQGNANTYGSYNKTLKCWQVHTGIDLNARTGGNSDAGDSVHCVADGEIVSVGTYPGWGGIIVVRHPQFGVRTRYAHVDNFKVKAGDFVKAGQVIALIAPAKIVNGVQVWSAHLHFDVIPKELPAVHWCFCSKDCVQKNYLDPTAWLLERNAMTNTTLRPARDE